MTKPLRRYTEEERDLIRKVWPTAISDKSLAERLGRTKSSVRRFAKDSLGLPCRAVARAKAVVWPA